MNLCMIIFPEYPDDVKQTDNWLNEMTSHFADTHNSCMENINVHDKQAVAVANKKFNDQIEHPDSRIKLALVDGGHRLLWCLQNNYIDLVPMNVIFPRKMSQLEFASQGILIAITTPAGF